MGQLLQTYRQDSDWRSILCNIVMAALPAGRIAASNTARGIDVLTLDMADSELAPAGAACQPKRAAKTALFGADVFARCAGTLDKP